MSKIDIEFSNNKLIQFIENEQTSGSVVRLGMGPETFCTFKCIYSNVLDCKYLHPIYNSLYNAGIYTNENDVTLDKIKLFCKYYNDAILNTDILSCFDSKDMYSIQNFYCSKYSLSKIHSRSLEPFYAIQYNLKPWTHSLINKKLLIIHPFVESFQKQRDNKFQMFKHTKLFLDKQHIIYYKSFQTIAGNHLHSDWKETFDIMCKDISNLDFDIALLGCGGYGLPLCNFIKKDLNKKSIYIGGGLQLLFGIMGKRWENNPMWKTIISENNTQFIKPSENELCSNLHTIENGCYW